MSKKTITTIEQVLSFVAGAMIVREGLGVQGRSLYAELAKDVLAVGKVEVKVGRGKDATVKTVKVTLDNRTAVKAAIAILIGKAKLPEDVLKKTNTLATGVMRTAGMYRSRQDDGKMADVKDVARQREQQKKDKAFDMALFKSVISSFKF